MSNNIVDEINKFEDAGVNIIEIIAGDVKKQFEDEIKRLRNEAGTRFYSDLLWTITFKRFDDDEAMKLWQEILEHKWLLGKQLGRNPGVRFAALDYLANIKGVLENVRIIGEKELDRILVFVNRDSLTGLYNHRYLHIRLAELASNTDRLPLSLMMCDLDGFKKYNDTFGHLFGDILLRQLAALIKSNLRGQDAAARYGGDEIAVILPNTPKKDAEMIANRLCETIDKHVFFMEDAKPDIRVTISIGVATMPEDTTAVPALIEKADRSLYKAKAEGKNRVFVFKHR